jgi:undecaprenyl-diphosphatase
MDIFSAIILAVVEGLTEYLPISSTGHIILASSLLGIQNDPFVKDYTVIVQFGAIMSVLVIYWRRFLNPTLDIYKKLIVGFLPAAIIGLSVKNHIDKILGSVQIVAWALIIGGIILIILDRKFSKTQMTDNNDSVQKENAKLNPLVSYRQAMLIGLVQCIAFIPGVSRSAATILGGLWQGLDRKSAAEFSFLLAVPTLTGAGLLKLIKAAPTLTADQVQFLIIGNIISFVVGWLTIRAFIHYLTRFGFDKFGWYRIGLGIIFLVFV